MEPNRAEHAVSLFAYVAGYDCLNMLGDVDSLHVERISCSGVLLFRYRRYVARYL
jgi:hypothetical protein